jgi:hypothetical protein
MKRSRFHCKCTSLRSKYSPQHLKYRVCLEFETSEINGLRNKSASLHHCPQHISNLTGTQSRILKVEVPAQVTKPAPRTFKARNYWTQPNRCIHSLKSVAGTEIRTSGSGCTYARRGYIKCLSYSVSGCQQLRHCLHSIHMGGFRNFCCSSASGVSLRKSRY